MKNQLVKFTTASAGLVRVPAITIERRIFAMRGHTVMLDSDLGKLYGVTTAAFNQAVKRNNDRFPSDFMFQLTDEEIHSFRITICDLRQECGRTALREGVASTVSMHHTFSLSRQPSSLVTAQYRKRFTEPRPQEAVLIFRPRQATSRPGWAAAPAPPPRLSPDSADRASGSAPDCPWPRAASLLNADSPFRFH